MLQELRVSPALLLFELVTAPLAAQGALGGRVTAQTTGGPIAGADVQILGTTLTGRANGDGRYRIPSVPPGTYAVQIRFVGYRPVVLTDIVIVTNRLTPLDGVLVPIPVELQELEVRPSYFPTHEAEPDSRLQFSAEEIRRAPGAAGDVSRILQTLPSLAKVNDQSNGLVVRGGSPMENLILVDGIEVPNINHFPVQGSSGGPIGLLNIALIHDASLSAGGFGAAYGDRLSSVLEVRLRDGTRERIAGQFDLNFVGIGGVLEGPLGASGSFVLSARRSYVDLAVRAFDVGTSVAPVYGDYQAKASWGLSDRHRISLVAVWADDYLSTDLPTAKENSMVSFGRQSLVQGTTGLAWDAWWSERVSSSTTAALTLSWFDEDYFETASNGAPLFHNDSREQAIRLRHRTDVRLGQTVLSLGGDLNRAAVRYDNRYEPHQGPLGTPVPGLDVALDTRGTRAGAFVSAAYAPVASATFTLGGRVDHDSYSGNTTVSPRASVLYRTSDRTSYSLAGGLYHQGLPPVLVGQKPSHRQLPDQRAWQVVAGMSHLLRDNLRLTAEVYHKAADRLPVDPLEPGLMPADELFTGYGFITQRDSLIAGGLASNSGLEVTLQQKLSGRVYGLVSGVWERSRYRALDGLWRDRIFNNRFRFAAEGGVRAGAWDFSARWLYAGGVPYTPLDLEASAAQNRSVYDATLINAARYPAYHSLNLRADRRFQVGQTTLRTFLSLWNAYNRKNVERYYWNTQTQQQDVLTQWSLLPVFGIEWKF